MGFARHPLVRCWQSGDVARQDCHRARRADVSANFGPLRRPQGWRGVLTPHEEMGNLRMLDQPTGPARTLQIKEALPRPAASEIVLSHRGRAEAALAGWQPVRPSGFATP